MKFGHFLITTTGMPKDIKVDFDKKLFEEMVQFITGLDPLQLTETQKVKIVEIIQYFTMSVGDQYVSTNEMCQKTHGKMKEYYDSHKDYFDNAFKMSNNTISRYLI